MERITYHHTPQSNVTSVVWYSMLIITTIIWLLWRALRLPPLQWPGAELQPEPHFYSELPEFRLLSCLAIRHDIFSHVIQFLQGEYLAAAAILTSMLWWILNIQAPTSAKSAFSLLKWTINGRSNLMNLLISNLLRIFLLNVTLDKLEIDMLVRETFTNEVLTTHPNIYQCQDWTTLHIWHSNIQTAASQIVQFSVFGGGKFDWTRQSFPRCVPAQVSSGLYPLSTWRTWGLTGAGDPHHWSRTLCKM